MSYFIVSKKHPFIAISKAFETSDQAAEIRTSLFKDEKGIEFDIVPETYLKNAPAPAPEPTEPVSVWNVIDAKGKVLTTIKATHARAAHLQRLMARHTKNKIVPSEKPN